MANVPPPKKNGKFTSDAQATCILFAMDFHSCSVVFADMMQYFCNLLQNGQEIAVRGFPEDLNMSWSTKDEDVHLSEYSKDDLSTS